MDESAARGDRVVCLEEGWADLKSKLIEPIAAYVVETTADDEQLVVNHSCTLKLFMSAYTLVYNMCVQRAPYNSSKKLYKRYDGTLRAFVGAHRQVLLTDLTVAWQCYSFFATVLSKPFEYLDRKYVKLFSLPTLREVSLNVFRSAMDTAYGSTEAANAAMNECSEITEKDKELLIAAHGNTTELSADVIAATALNIVVKVKELKLANLCLKQLRAALASEIKAVSDTEQKASLSEQLRVVKAMFAGELTLNELHEEWQKWSSSSTHVSSIWSAFNTAETSSTIEAAAATNSVDVECSRDSYDTSVRPARKLRCFNCFGSKR
jgi:Cullin family